VSQWYERAYRRVVVDMHITDHDPRFMSQFDPEQYVAMLRLARAQSAVVYAHSHVGLCYFPTKLGPMHTGLGGRDAFGEVVALCRREGIAVVAYLSAVYDTQAYREHPDWRITDSHGNEAGANSRYGICCPNAPYRDYIAGLAREVCEGYEVDGVRFDMTFWPRVCYCRHCAERFAREVGGELPRTIHWHDPTWVRFQRKREEWLTDFAGHLTAAVKRVNPAISVEHQASTYGAPWTLGVTHHLAAQCDFLQGDFYGDALQGSFVRKLFQGLSPHLPFGFETCISVDLGNYTTLKSEELLRAKASASLADGGAFVFIDSLDPAGTLNPAAYRRMGGVFGTVAPYEQHLGGTPVQDVAAYFSTESKCDFADNGKQIDGPGLSGALPHVEAAVGACKGLLDHHLPFGVITAASLGSLSRYRVVVLPNVLMMSAEEAAAFREYVRAGGCLYASKHTSLTTTDGQRQADFLLADVFGVCHASETPEGFTYLVPEAGEEALLPEYTAAHPAGLAGTQTIVRPGAASQVLSRIALPYTDPGDQLHFASIHNNPPGRYTEHPAIVLHRFGEGQCIYAAGDLERHEPHRDLFIRLLRRLCDTFSCEVEAPRCVECTVFRQDDRGRYVIALVNFQKELPNVPVEGVRVRLRVPGQEAKRLVLLPDGVEVPLQREDDHVSFEAPRLDTLLMFALETG